MAGRGSPTDVVYTATSQFWLDNEFFKPIALGGRAIEEGDPILRKLPAKFERYQPKTRKPSEG